MNKSDIHSFDKDLPTFSTEEPKISMIKKCRLCKFRYLCGGGCVGRMINNSFTVSSQGGQCHDFEKLLNVAIKENYHERIKADEIHDFYTTQ